MLPVFLLRESQVKELCQVMGQVAKLPRYQWAGCQQRRQQGLIWLLRAPRSDSNIFHFVLLQQQIVLVSTLHASKIGGQNLEIKFNELGPQRFESSPGTWSNFIAGGFDCKASFCEASFCARILRTQQVWLASTPKPSTYLETDPNTNACMHLHASLKLFTHSYIIKKAMRIHTHPVDAKALLKFFHQSLPFGFQLRLFLLT